MAVIECVPNISEGRRLDVVAALADSLRAAYAWYGLRDARRALSPGRSKSAVREYFQK